MLSTLVDESASDLIDQLKSVRRDHGGPQTPAQSLGARLTILCKLEAPEGLANNTRQQTRGWPILRDES